MGTPRRNYQLGQLNQFHQMSNLGGYGSGYMPPVSSPGGVWPLWPLWSGFHGLGILRLAQGNLLARASHNCGVRLTHLNGPKQKASNIQKGYLQP